MGLYFNLSEEEREFAKQKTMFCLIIYDIRSNKRRLKLSKLLEGYGVRVQNPVSRSICQEMTISLSLRISRTSTRPMKKTA